MLFAWKNDIIKFPHMEAEHSTALIVSCAPKYPRETWPISSVQSHFHTWKLKMQLLLSYPQIQQFMEQHDPPPLDSYLCKEWCKNDRNTMAINGLFISDIRLEHVADAKTTHEMWRSILVVLERHTVRNLLPARPKKSIPLTWLERRKCYPLQT